MAHHKLTFLALACAGTFACAQDATTQRIVISGRAALLTPDVVGFGDDVSAARTPLQARRIDDGVLQAVGAKNLAALTQLDAAVSDAYNSAGYWSALTIRGYTLDQRSNYRRDGLPINAETAIALDNKAALDLMKGISGLQAGVSSSARRTTCCRRGSKHVKAAARLLPWTWPSALAPSSRWACV
jgi:iron complex outermembrane recepter protein